MVEVMLSLIIFLMIALMFGAAIPAATRGARYSGTFQQAISVTQHKIDQLREAGYARLNSASIVSRSLADSCSVSSTTTTCGFTTTDAITSFFGAGAVGTLVVAPYTPSFVAATNQYSLLTVTVTLTWKDASKAIHSYSASAIISQG